MCGIAGVLMFRPSANGRGAGALVTDMTEALRHRGPDGGGVAVCRASETGGPAVAIGHRRLAVIDLSDRAAQPMRSADQPIWITFNGEVFNFAAVRRRLESCGRRFHSDSDTEVVLQGYEHWGLEVVDHLQGMFAFAIWDDVARRLVLARDRLGIKPLYVYRGLDFVLFASEVRALLRSGLVPPVLDQESTVDFLAYQTAPTPRTLVAGVNLIKPGHLVTVGSDGGWTERRYWDLLAQRSPEAAGSSEGEARRRVRDLLLQAAESHLVSDVPVGVFLSGGIDSSALVALTSAIGVRPRTFAVVMPGMPEDESRHAEVVAAQFKTDHTEIAVEEREMQEAIPTALGDVDHPSGDGLNTFIVSQAVRRAGIKVALSGLGGDELFGGYPSFHRLSRLRAYSAAWRRSPRAVRRVAAAAVRTIGRRAVAVEKAAAVLETDGSLAQAFPVLRQLFSARQRRRLVGGAAVSRRLEAGDPYQRLIEQAAETYPDADVMALTSFAEVRTYMHDVLLRDTDQMSMAHGLEARVPLLDHPLVEFVMGLPAALKAANGTPKRLLVESLPVPLPDACVRRPKQGFVLPFDRWMRGDLRRFCERRLGPAGLGGRGVFDPVAIEATWQAFLAGDRRMTWSRPWALVALDAWMEQNGIRPWPRA
jgi:asparagine synthase (glutamine-hydrolysing)